MDNISFNTYTIKKGNHTSFDWAFLMVRATILIWWFFKKKKIKVWCKFDENCLYDFKGDQDQKDFNKLFGVNLNAFQASDQNSAMVGWRVIPQWGWLEVTPYVNKDGNAFWTKDNYRGGEVFWNIMPKELFFIEFTPIKANEWRIGIGKNINGKWEVKSNVFKYSIKAFIMRLIPSWFGGDDNNNDGQGGVAPHDMTTYLNHEITKQ